MKTRTEHRNLTREECQIAEEKILKYLGAEGLRGGSIIRAHIDYWYDVDEKHIAAVPKARLNIYCDGDFSYETCGSDDSLIPHWIQFDLEGPMYYGQEYEGCLEWEVEACYYATMGTEILESILCPIEDLPFCI